MFKVLFLIFLFGFQNIFAQSEKIAAIKISEIYQKALTDGKSYLWLQHLTKQIGGRPTGSLNAERAINWASGELRNLGLDSLWLQPVMVPKWVRGTFEYASFESSPGNTINVKICSLGGSISTPKGGIRSKVVEIKSIEELEKIGEEKIKGKIVFFNRPMQPNLINTFSAYANAVDQRYSGAEESAKYGAAAVIVRSLNLRLDDIPHTGIMSYGKLPINQRIPAASSSTNDAQLLSSMISLNPDLIFFLRQDCKNYPDVKSYNVIGQVNGFESPEKIILIGAHLDSWDLGEGAHDDGAGVVQSMEVLNLFDKINYKPKNSIRIVLFMGEENGRSGAITYSKGVSKIKEKHIIALESDSGGFTPRGFNFETSDYYYEKIQSWKSFFDPYNIHLFLRGGSAPDVSLLKNNANILAGLKTDSQRYFIHHHSEMDVFESINKRELELGSASMATLIYLIDYLGF